MGIPVGHGSLTQVYAFVCIVFYLAVPVWWIAWGELSLHGSAVCPFPSDQNDFCFHALSQCYFLHFQISKFSVITKMSLPSKIFPTKVKLKKKQTGEVNRTPFSFCILSYLPAELIFSLVLALLRGHQNLWFWLQCPSTFPSSVAKLLPSLHSMMGGPVL